MARGLLPHRWKLQADPHTPRGRRAIRDGGASVGDAEDGRAAAAGESLSSPPGTTLTIEDDGAVLTMRTEELPTPYKRRRLPGGSLLQGKSGRF